MYLFIIFILTIIIPLILMPRSMRSGRISPFRNVFYAALSTGIAAAVVFMFASLAKEGMFPQIKELISDISVQVAADPVWDSLPGFSDLNSEDRVSLITGVYETLAMTLPAYIMTAAVIVAYIEYIIISNMPWNRGKAAGMPGFREFSLPPDAFTGIFLMYFASWAVSMSGGVFGEAVYLNINFIFDFAFILQGMSVVFMFVYLKRMPKAVAVIVIIIALSNNICRMLLVLIGMFDLIIGIKAKMKGRTAKK